MSKKQESDAADEVPQGIYHLSENFSSVYFGNAPDQTPGVEKENSGLVKTLLETLNTEDRPGDREAQELKHAVLVKLRENKGEEILIALLDNEALKNHHRLLAMACWESGINFFGHLIFFVTLAIKSDLEVCLEAITVIQEMRGTADDSTHSEAVEILKNALAKEKGTVKANLLQELYDNIEQRHWPEPL